MLNPNQLIKTAAMSLALCTAFACGGDDPASTNNAATNNATNNTTIELPTPPKCDDPNPPDRCAEDAAEKTWDVASIVTDLYIEGTASCCFDMTGDGSPDNGLGSLLASVGQLDGLNESVAESIESGDLTIVVEHAGLTDLAGGSFTANFWLGERDDTANTIDPAGSNGVMIDPESIDQGTHPTAYLPMGNLADGVVTAGPGTVNLAIAIVGLNLNLIISNAMIEAEVDAANSSLEAGVALTNGKLGGIVLADDIIAAVNAVASTCTCLALEGELLEKDAMGIFQCATPDTAGCDENVSEESTCLTLVDQCALLALLPDISTDVDVNGDGLNDAVSVGATFTAAGAVIGGVLGQ
jgi:hypothetical protein